MSENLILIKEGNCIACGKCVDVCGAKVLILSDKVEIAYPELCISCGHCVAICDYDALSSNPLDNQKDFIVRDVERDISVEHLSLIHISEPTRPY